MPEPKVVAGGAVEAVTAAPKTTADSFIEKHAVNPIQARLMRSQLPKSQKGIDAYLDEFASTPGKRTTMERELKEFLPEEA